MECAMEARERAHEREMRLAANRERALFKVLSGVFEYYSQEE